MPLRRVPWDETTEWHPGCVEFYIKLGEWSRFAIGSDDSCINLLEA